MRLSSRMFPGMASGNERLDVPSFVNSISGLLLASFLELPGAAVSKVSWQLAGAVLSKRLLKASLRVLVTPVVYCRAGGCRQDIGG